MEIIKDYLKNGQYIDIPTEKKAITLHHTCGTTAKGALDWWDQTPARIGTAYVIDLDGKIYEAFDPKHWAYHIGINGDKDWFEKHNIGIELVSPGGLVYEKSVDEFRFYPLWPNRSKYKVIKEEKVIECDYRGWRYFYAYSDIQIHSLIELMTKLINDFKIPLQPYNLFERFWDYKPEVIADRLPGIWSHSTLRSDKSDIFPYEPLIKAMKGLYKDMVNEPEPKKPYEEKVEPSKVVIDKAPKKKVK